MVDAKSMSLLQALGQQGFDNLLNGVPTVTVTTGSTGTGSTGGGTGGGSTTSVNRITPELSATTITGTSGNDYIDLTEQRHPVSGNVEMFKPSMLAIDGKEGNDEVVLQFSGNNNPASITNVETISLDGWTAAATVSMHNVSNHLKTLNSKQNTAGGMTVTSLTGKLDTVGWYNTNQDFSITMSNDLLSGTEDHLDVNMGNVTAGTLTVTPASASSGYESMTVNVMDDSIVTKIANTYGTGLTTLNFKGSGNLTLNGAAPAIPATVTTLNAALTDNVFTGNLTFGTAAQLMPAVASVTLGSGNDTYWLGGNYASTQTLDGGAGVDTLGLTTAAAVVATSQTNVSNFENIAVSDAAGGVNLTYFPGATGVIYSNGLTGATTTTVNSGSTLTFNAGTDSTNHARTLTVVGGSGSEVTMVFNDHDVTGGSTTTVTGARTLNLVSNKNLTGAAADGGANVFGPALSMTDTSSTVNVTGDEDYTLTGVATFKTLDASGFDQVLTLSAIPVSVTASGVSITAGNGNNVIRGSVGADTIVVGNGNNTVNLGQTGAIDTVTLGSGDNIIDWTDKASAQMITSANRAYVSGFKADGTAYSAGNGVDRIDLGNVHTGVDISGGATSASWYNVTTPASITATNAQQFIELAWEFSPGVNLNAGSANELNGTTLLSALGGLTGTTAGTITVGTNDYDAVIIAYQSNKAFVYGSHNNDGNTGIAAAEIGLLGVFDDVAVGGFDYSQFV